MTLRLRRKETICQRSWKWKGRGDADQRGTQVVLGLYLMISMLQALPIDSSPDYYLVTGIWRRGYHMLAPQKPDRHAIGKYNDRAVLVYDGLPYP
jgi:hypothetical protein